MTAIAPDTLNEKEALARKQVADYLKLYADYGDELQLTAERWDAEKRQWEKKEVVSQEEAPDLFVARWHISFLLVNPAYRNGRLHLRTIENWF
jgi:hypothetical protein